MARTSYRGDPYWLDARFASACACGNPDHHIRKGDRIFYYPKGKKAFVGPCADANARDFESCVADEDFYNRAY